VVVFFASPYLDQIFRARILSSVHTDARIPHRAGSGEYVLAILLVAVVAVTEEIISRGYLILRVTTVTGSSALAIALSSVIFSLGHGYEGTAGVVTVGVIGLTFALVYVWAENLAAPIL